MGPSHKTGLLTSLMLVCFLAISTIAGASLQPANTEEHHQPADYVTQFGPSFAEVPIVTSADGLDEPRDLEFHPSPLRQGELWIVNRATDSATIVTNAGQEDQSSDTRQDAYGYHFMEEVSAIAFGTYHEEFDYQFATAQESRNTYNGQGEPNDFMGPALWPSSLSHFAVENQESGGLLGSHLDMLHESPLGMGIAHDSGNAYWYNDGFYGELVHYDFNQDHDTGEDDHSDGAVKRFTEISLTRVADVPGHMEFDEESGILYISDTGAGRILWVNTSDEDFTTSDITGSESQMEVLAEYSEVTGVEWGILSTGLSMPSGLAIHDNRVFVSQNGNGRITAFNLDESGKNVLSSRTVDTNASSIMGLEIDFSGKLWYADSERNLVVRLDPFPDLDYDGVRDSQDSYPEDGRIWSDQDGDGFADQTGTEITDACPATAGTSTLGLMGCPDSDDDGWADISDEYPQDSTQWSDSDSDGYGDNPDGLNPDGCPYTEGYSVNDRKGCPDTDEDGYSDPTVGWGASDGADAFPTQDSQWSDRDSDGYGDNTYPAYMADDCPETHGSSQQDRLGCEDGDGDGWSNTGDAFPSDVTQWMDSDSDGHGDNPAPATSPDACPFIPGNSTGAILGCPDADGDGFSDDVDSHPEFSGLWSDADGDGFGDQPGYEMSDDCPGSWGTSNKDKNGCLDTDGDGWSDGGDYYPNDSSRHQKLNFTPYLLVAFASLIALGTLILRGRRGP